jgi:Uma2 family endonuclease
VRRRQGGYTPLKETAGVDCVELTLPARREKPANPFRSPRQRSRGKMKKKEENMATTAKPSRVDRRVRGLPPLENGDRLDQITFHARYKGMPKHTRAELVGGTVYIMASPQKVPHGASFINVLRWATEYEDATPGTEVQANNTQILGAESELQPDVCLFIVPEHGGQVRVTEDNYLAGPLDFVAEISSSTESIDLHAKKRDYERSGVKEYVVVALRKKQVFWFVRQRGKFKQVPPDEDGIYRSQVFPGLWLDPAALLRRDRKRLLAVLREGLSTSAHAAFVAKLARH